MLAGKLEARACNMMAGMAPLVGRAYNRALAALVGRYCWILTHSMQPIICARFCLTQLGFVIMFLAFDDTHLVLGSIVLLVGPIVDFVRSIVVLAA